MGFAWLNNSRCGTIRRFFGAPGKGGLLACSASGLFTLAVVMILLYIGILAIVALIAFYGPYGTSFDFSMLSFQSSTRPPDGTRHYFSNGNGELIEKPPSLMPVIVMAIGALLALAAKFFAILCAILGCIRFHGDILNSKSPSTVLGSESK